MPSSINDFIQTFMGMAQLQNQQEQTDNARKAQAVQGVNTFMTIARQTADPMLLTGLVDRFAALGVAPKDELLQILQNVTPTGEALKAYGTRQGMLQAAGAPTDSTTSESQTLNRETANTELTGQNSGQLATQGLIKDLIDKIPRSGANADMMATALGTKTAAGLSPGQLVLDHALSVLPQNEITQGAGIQMGTRMSAPQDANNQLGWANLREENRKNTQYGALQEAGLNVDLQKAGMAANSKAGAQEHIPNLLATKEQLVSKLTDSKSPPPAGLVISYIGALNAINQQLTGFGVANEGQISYDPQMLTNPSWLQGLKQRLAGQNNITFTQPDTTQRRSVRPPGRK